MPPVWLRPEAGGAWAYFPSVADATAHLKEQGIELFATQVSRAAKNGKTRNGWEFPPPRLMRMSPHFPQPPRTWHLMPDNAKVGC